MTVTKKQIFEQFTKTRLKELAESLDVDLTAGQPKAKWVDTLSRKRTYKTEDILEQLKRDELKRLCETNGLSNAGRDKMTLINRLLGKDQEEEKVKENHHIDESQEQIMPEENAENIDEKVGEEIKAIEDGMMLDYLSNKPIKETPKELVRQKTLRALFHEYGLSADDMALDVAVKVGGKRKKIDIAIFEHGEKHTLENIRRIVMCDKTPKTGKKSAVKMRDHDQAQKDLQLMEDMMREFDGDTYTLPQCQWGLWTNGIEFFFVEKQPSRFDTEFKAVGDWPFADETMGSRDVASNAQLRTADREMLLTAFRRCHNFIHGNEGMPKDAAFWQFLYLIFSKMYDERIGNKTREFWASPTEQFNDEGRIEIRKRIEPLFEKVKAAYPEIFKGNEEITLSDRALAFMVSELAKYDFSRTEMDAKGAAYQEVVGDNLRGDRGQYFTPRGAISYYPQSG